MIGEAYKIDIETGTRVIPSEDDLSLLMPSASELYRHISGRAMTRKQLLGRITCYYQGFVEPSDMNERLLTDTIWEASGTGAPAT